MGRSPSLSPLRSSFQRLLSYQAWLFVGVLDKQTIVDAIRSMGDLRCAKLLDVLVQGIHFGIIPPPPDAQ